MKIKENLFFFLFLIDLTGNSLQNNNRDKVFGDYGISRSEINDSNVIRDRMEELGILHYEVFELPLKGYGSI